MTVAELRKALKGVKGSTPVYTRDHDHGEYETNGLANYAGLRNQKKMDEYDKQNFDKCFEIKGSYFIVSA